MSLALASRRAAISPAWVKNSLWRTARAVPSLDLQFADTKSLADAVTGQLLITFTRASSGTYVGSDGVLQTAANDVPRFDHNPTTGESLGLLVEEQRTNLLLRSEEFDNASWAKTLATVTADAGVAPSGLTVADKLIGNSTVDAHYAQQNISGATNGISYTSSVYAKAAEISRIEILHVVGAVLYAQGYDLSNGTLLTRVTGGTTAATGGFIQSVGNGWYRCGIIQTSDGTSGAMRVTLRSANTVVFDATSQGVLLWGAQLEAGSFLTSYIPTTTATVTRNADVASITGTAFSSWYRQDEGTVFVEGITAPVLSRFPTEWSLHDGTDTNTIAAYNFTTVYALTLRKSGEASTDPTLSLTPVSGVAYKKAAAIKSSDYRVSAQGQQGASANPAFMPATNELRIGAARSGGSALNSTIRRLTYWPARLPNSTLQALTQ